MTTEERLLAYPVRVHVLDPDWNNDTLAVDPEQLGVYPASDENPDNNTDALPIRFNGGDMAALRKSVIGLAERGTECWPGCIMPLQPGERYGVWHRDKWIAIVGVLKPTPPPEIVLQGRVVLKADGRRYVANKDHPLPPGARVLTGKPHEEGTEAQGFDYVCGSEWCRCSQ